MLSETSEISSLTEAGLLGNQECATGKELKQHLAEQFHRGDGEVRLLQVYGSEADNVGSEQIRQGKTRLFQRIGVTLLVLCILVTLAWHFAAVGVERHNTSSAHSLEHSQGKSQVMGEVWQRMIRGAEITLNGGTSPDHEEPDDLSADLMAANRRIAQGAVCGLVQEDVDYPGNDLRAVPNVTSSDLCCQLCSFDGSCLAWTWGKKRGDARTDVCFLKGGRPRERLTKVMHHGSTSGMPTQVHRSIPTVKRVLGQSLYCFSLIVPWGYEKSLVAMQYDKSASIFGCDEYATFSDRKMQVAPGVITSVVDVDVKSKKGGEFGTALNTDIFIVVWRKVFSEQRFRLHDWTVKIDADSVFFPGRLRYALLAHSEGADGVYINNCKLGMHGPIEVFSTNAVYVWDHGIDRCKQHFSRVCNGDCLWGEDMFIDQCLSKVLFVRRESNYNMLVEDHCDPPPNWNDCMRTDIAAFHPFKSLSDWRQCWQNAHAENQMVK